MNRSKKEIIKILKTNISLVKQSRGKEIEGMMKGYQFALKLLENKI